MADRTSAALFANIFKLLAEDPDEVANRYLAQHIYEMTGEYDFMDYQMECDKELKALGVAQYYAEDDD